MTGLLRRSSLPLSWLEVQFGRQLEALAVRQLVLSLLSGRHFGRVVFEAESRDERIAYRLGSAYPERLKETLELSVPGSHASAAVRLLPEVGTTVEVKLSTHRRPLDNAHPEAMTARLLHALRTVGGGQAIYQVVLGERLRPNAIPADLEGFESESWAGALLEAAMSGSKRLSTETRRSLAAKEGLPGARVNLRLLCSAENSGPSLAHFESALRSVESPGLRIKLVRSEWDKAVSAEATRRAVPLNLDEISGLLAWPLGEGSYPGVDRSGAQALAFEGREAKSRILGIGTHPARRVPVGLTASDGLRHAHVLGPTGVGKSNLLMHMIGQDIADGRSVVVLDPKGDLVEDVLARVKRGDLDRVVVLDPASTSEIVGFNPLAVRPDETELAVDGILNSFRQMHSDSWGPRSQDILHSSLLTLAGTPWASLAFVPSLLGDQAFRAKVLRATHLPPVLAGFWSWFQTISDAERASAIAPLQNKLRPLVLRSSTRGLLGQVQPAFDPKTIFTERKVLLVPLRKGQIGPLAANLIGLLVIARIWQLALQRSNIPAERRHAVFLYADEFQDYLSLPTDFADVLAQARGLGLGMVLAHQHLGQLTATIRSSVLANAQNRISFRASPDDAVLLGRINPDLEPADFAGLARYQAYARLLENGQMLAPVSIRTLPPGNTERSAQQALKQLSGRWGVPLTEVDAYLEAQATHQPDQAAPGRRKRGSQ